MNNEKAYQEALERAKNLYKDAIDMGENILAKQCEIIFPELKESEDEKIRKAILTGLIDCRDAPDLGWSNFGGISIDDCISWLEKQGQKKPVWNEKDDGYKLVALSAFLNYYDEENPLRKCLINWLKSLKQKIKEK